MTFKSNREAIVSIKHAMNLGYHDVAKTWISQCIQHMGWTQAETAMKLGLPSDTLKEYMRS